MAEHSEDEGERDERLFAEIERRFIKPHVLVHPWLIVLIPILMVALPFVASEFTANRIRVHYDRQLEDYRRQLEVRDRAAVVAEYVAMWYVSGRLEATENVDSMAKLEFYRKMNQLSFELALYLPADVYKELGPALVRQPEAKDPGQILVDVRRRLLAEPGDLTSENIIYHWPNLKALAEAESLRKSEEKKRSQ